MKDYSSAFLGMILAGVVMLVIGLGLIVTPTESRPRASFQNSTFQNKKLAEQTTRFSTDSEIRPVARESR